MKPDWDKLANKLKDAKKVQIADVDCTVSANQGLCQAEGVKGYPTVKYYRNGVGVAYQQGRDYNSLYKYVRKEAAARKKREEQEATQKIDVQTAIDELKEMDAGVIGNGFLDWIDANRKDKTTKKVLKSFQEFMASRKETKQEL